MRHCSIPIHIKLRLIDHTGNESGHRIHVFYSSFHLFPWWCNNKSIDRIEEIVEVWTTENALKNYQYTCRSRQNKESIQYAYKKRKIMKMYNTHTKSTQNNGNIQYTYKKVKIKISSTRTKTDKIKRMSSTHTKTD